MTNVSLADLRFRSPFLNAAGLVNGTSERRILHEVDQLAQSACGAITVGSFTVSPQEGNEAKYGAPVDYFDGQTGAMYNAMGLPNIGLKRALKLAPEIINHAQDAPVIFSGSPFTAEDGPSVEQATRLAYELGRVGAHIIELNVSCPNVVVDGTGRKPIMGYDFEAMHELVESLERELGNDFPPVAIKLPPYITEQQHRVVPSLAQLFKDSNIVDILVTSNTIPGQVVTDNAGEPILSVPGGAGGMSGPATKAVGRNQLSLWRKAVGDHLPLISTLGVFTGEEVALRESLGAVASSGVSLFWRSRNWARSVDRVLVDYSITSE